MYILDYSKALLIGTFNHVDVHCYWTFTFRPGYISGYKTSELQNTCRLMGQWLYIFPKDKLEEVGKCKMSLSYLTRS